MRASSRPAFFQHALRGVALAASLALVACAGSSSDEPDYVERPAEDIYNEGLHLLDQRRYVPAARQFIEVERQHPYSQWSTRGQLMSAYAFYEAARFDEALEVLERFIQLHPGNESIPYAYYLRALCYYEQITDVERDQSMTLDAMDALREVYQRFPDTEYARDARLKYDLTLDQVAGAEMAVGRWYLRQGHYNAAVGRFRGVVRDYQTTTHVPEALHRLTEAYLALGLTEEARQVAAVLGYNYPGSEWYLDSYALLVDEGVRPPDERSAWQRTLDSLF